MYNEEMIERDALIADIIALGKNYKFYKYTNAQLWHIKRKLIEQQKKDLIEARQKIERLKEQQEAEKKKPVLQPRFTEVISNNTSYYQDNETGQLSFFMPTEEEIMKLSKKRKRGSK